MLDAHEVTAIQSIVSFKSIADIKNLGDLFDVQMQISTHLEREPNQARFIQALAEFIIEHIAQHFKHHSEAMRSRDVLQIVFDCIKDNDTLKRAILEKLEAYRTKNHPDGLREIALFFLAQYDPKNTIKYLIDVARDPSESQLLRSEALQRIFYISPENGTLSLLLEIIQRNEDAHLADVITLIEQQHRQFDRQATLAALEALSQRTEASIAVRCRAIKALGLFGDLNCLERQCLLSERDPAIQNAILEMITLLVNRPIDVLTIRPENFEQLIKKLLLKFGYYDVNVTRSVRDGGVDVVAYKTHQGIHNKPYKTIVQCKRYAPTNTVDQTVVEKLVEDIQAHCAKEGQLIITSAFSERAKIFAQNHQYIELVDGPALQALLNQAFGKHRYCIGNA